MNRIPSREQVERLRQRYPTGTRIVLHSMDDAQAPPTGTMGTVVYVDDMGKNLPSGKFSIIHSFGIISITFLTYYNS